MRKIFYFILALSMEGCRKSVEKFLRKNLESLFYANIFAGVFQQILITII